MSKSKSTKSATKTGPGRPLSKVAYPNGKFTEKQAKELNGCFEDPPRLCGLTVRNHIQADILGKDSVLVLLDDRAKSDGKGRKAFLYQKRSQVKKSATPRKVKVPTVTVSVPVVDIPAPTPETVTETVPVETVPVAEQAPVTA
jgi:hypothetical protein